MDKISKLLEKLFCFWREDCLILARKLLFFDIHISFRRVFHPKKSTIFSWNQSWIFGHKMKISNSVLTGFDRKAVYLAGRIWWTGSYGHWTNSSCQTSSWTSTIAELGRYTCHYVLSHFCRWSFRLPSSLVLFLVDII